MTRTIGFGFGLLLCGTTLLASPASPGERMFERMKGLAGDWEGTLEWTGGRTGSGPLKASYYLTGNGSALVENLIMGDMPSMTTVYHLDGTDLRMTHYCGARNQPRLKASTIDETGGAIDFAFVDVTNAVGPNPAYVNRLQLRLLDADRIELRFTFGGPPGVSGLETIELKRASSPSGHSGSAGTGAADH